MFVVLGFLGHRWGLAAYSLDMPGMIKSVSYSKTMKITLDIPDPIAARLADDRETLTRRSLELLAIEAYRKGTLGAGEVGQLLGFNSRWDTYNFLQKEQAEPPLSKADLESDALLGQA